MAGDDVLMLIIGIFFWTGVALASDLFATLPCVKQKLSTDAWKLPAPDLSLEDDMVKAEKTRIAGLKPADQLLFVNNLAKVYKRQGFVHAVKGISFAADEGQVFGLLGVNGAGKTTTFKMLCGQVEPTSGEVQICGLDVGTQVHEVRKLIGYCPQFDALLDVLTVQEHLELFGRIKGLTGTTLSEAVQSQLKEMDLNSYIQSRAGRLSGGNKRKLSVAMATIGEPPMVFLDEPSAGMDPVARRFMWSVVQGIADRRKKSVVILTTHSMEEAEALCSRIAIQVDGLFRCLGTAQQIKTIYGQGLELTARLSSPTQWAIADWCSRVQALPTLLVDQNTAVQFISKMHPVEAILLFWRPGDTAAFLRGALSVGGRMSLAVIVEWVLTELMVLKLEGFLFNELSRESGGMAVAQLIEKQGGAVRYQILPAALQGQFKSLGPLFQMFQEAQKDLCMEDFQLCQTSLEQIFNRFASTQLSQEQIDRFASTQISQQQMSNMYSCNPSSDTSATADTHIPEPTTQEYAMPPVTVRAPTPEPSTD